MVTKKTPTSKTKAAETKVTRIKATDDKPKVIKDTSEKEVKATKKKAPKAKKASKTAWLKPFKALGGYFKGAWQELKLVHWPTRGATWSLTAAVLAFSAFFVVVIILLDTLFNYLLRLIIG